VRSKETEIGKIEARAQLMLAQAQKDAEECI